MNSAPIGVFDSGVGGISVLNDLRRLLPNEDYIYYSDAGYCPYGGRPQHEIQARAVAITELLLERGAKIIVVACNTATIAAVEYLRATYAVPPLNICGRPTPCRSSAWSRPSSRPSSRPARAWSE
jgi:glutamate racemase